MKLYATIESERGKAVSKSGNEYLIIDLNVGRNKVHQIELCYKADTETDDTAEMDEWVLQHRTGTSEDAEDWWTCWDIIAQGNVYPEKKDKSKRTA